MIKPTRPTAEDIAARKAAEVARAEARATWIAENPRAHAAEQAALEASRQARIAAESE